MNSNFQFSFDHQSQLTIKPRRSPLLDDSFRRPIKHDAVSKEFAVNTLSPGSESVQGQRPRHHSVQVETLKVFEWKHYKSSSQNEYVELNKRELRNN